MVGDSSAAHFKLPSLSGGLWSHRRYVMASSPIRSKASVAPPTSGHSDPCYGCSELRKNCSYTFNEGLEWGGLFDLCGFAGTLKTKVTHVPHLLKAGHRFSVINQQGETPLTSDLG